ncbi:ABC transporter ATP-binding protein [Bradyrhizobium sp. RDT10]
MRPAVTVSERRKEAGPAITSPELVLSGVGLRLGAHAILEGIDLTIGRGEFVSVLGPSGCGKTTLLRVLAGLYQPTAGRVACRGEMMTRPRQDIAIIFQDYGRALLPWRTAHGNVALALEAIGARREQRDARISALLAKVGLAGQDKKYPSEMSGGMQQRLQIARCLAQDPRSS